MTNKPDNRPAFPTNSNAVAGMSLRDWFAGMAMQGLMSSETIIATLNELANERNMKQGKFTAETAYEMADYMLKERNNE